MREKLFHLHVGVDLSASEQWLRFGSILERVGVCTTYLLVDSIVIIWLH